MDALVKHKDALHNIADDMFAIQDWKAATWTWSSKSISHPTQGTGYNQVIGNKYRRLSTHIKFGLFIPQTYAVRVLILKQKVQVPINTIASTVFRSANFSTGNLLTNVSSFISPLSEWGEYTFEVLYDHVYWHTDADFRFYELKFEFDEVLDILNYSGQINVVMASTTRGGFESLAEMQMVSRTEFIG